MPKTRVLIVDDQPTFRRRLRQLLTRAGMTVVGEAGNIPEARELTRKLMPDLAIVDVFMPGESGMDGAPQLKALAPKMRVILVSAQYDQSRMIQELSQKAGVEAFVPKDDLDLEVVTKWIGKTNHDPDTNI
jgi:two-component system chemotaxis response regulator CheY